MIISRNSSNSEYFKKLIEIALWIKSSGLTQSMQFVLTQNMADTSGATNTAQHSDFSMWADDALICKGDAERFSHELKLAKSELTEKMKGWNTIALRGLPFLPCFAVGGNRLQFCAISPPCKIWAGCYVDMAIADQRLSIMRISLNFFRSISILSPSCRQMLLYKVSDRGNGCSLTVSREGNLSPSASGCFCL